MYTFSIKNYTATVKLYFNNVIVKFIQNVISLSTENDVIEMNVFSTSENTFITTTDLCRHKI
jgi:hypothetical protein